MEEKELLKQNPWFKGISSINNDPDLKKLENKKIKWEPRIRKYFKFNKDYVYTIRGPRQVGKTTLVKSMIRSIITENGVNPFGVFYFSLDLLEKPEELVDLIESYYSLSARFGVEGGRFVFLDEISNIKGWEKGLKHLIDTGKSSNTVFILTGSHSLDIKDAIERLPGRKGEEEDIVLDKIMMPMKFSEYIETLDKDLSKGLRPLIGLKKEKKRSVLSKLFEGEIDPLLIREPTLYSDELDSKLKNFMLTGGIPRPINEFAEFGRIRKGIYSIYLNSLIGDLSRRGLSERIAKQIIRSVAEKMTTKVSINSIAKENEIGSHNTVMKYLDGLESAFTINTFYQIDITNGRIKNKKDKKIYFTDPFIFHAMRSWATGFRDPFDEAMEFNAKNEGMSNMVEMAVSNHLIRLSCGMNPSGLFSHHENVTFFRKKGKKWEVDFRIIDKGEILPIEVKYTNQIRREDLRGLFSLGRGLILTKDLLKVDRKYVYLPVKYFLLLI